MIKNIIFDIGGVLLSYRCTEMLVSFGMEKNEAEKLTDLMFQDELWHKFDLVGREGEPEIIAAFIEKYPAYARELDWFLHHTEQMHVKRENIWELVHQLKQKGYMLYYLSNYPESMFELHTGDASFIKDMEGGVVSWQIHKAKPDPAIYEHLINTYHLKADECLFFDDLEENTKAAAALGIHTITVTSQVLLAEKLKELIAAAAPVEY